MRKEAQGKKRRDLERKKGKEKREAERGKCFSDGGARLSAGKRTSGERERRAEKKGGFPENKNTRVPCPVFERCGGCCYLDMSYEQQLRKKQKRLQELLGDFGNLEPIVGMENPWHYRHKVHAVFGRDRKGNPVSGIYAEGTHKLVPVDACLIEDEKSDAIIVTIRSLLKSFRIKTYEEDSGYGLLRHVLVRKGFRTGEIMVVLVLSSPILPSKNNFVKALRREHPEITTVVVNINDRNTSMVLGDRDVAVYGKGYIEDRLCGCTFRISPRSFYQVNPAQTEVLYQTAVSWAGLTGKERVLDAYCGTGTIGLAAASGAGEVIGVERNQDAVRDAIWNIRRNQAGNVRVYCADATEFIREMAERKEKLDVIFLDPPRSGSTPEFLNAAAEIGPERMIYISCNPETLARDLKELKKRGYRSEKMQGIDCFAWTEHVETVVLMSRVAK